MDSFEWNKIAGAVLFALLVGVGLRIATEILFEAEAPETPGYIIATAEEGGGAEPEAPMSIAVLLMDADPDRGGNAAKKCQACHTFAEGEPNRVGPNLFGVVMNAIASHDGYEYSEAMHAYAEEAGEWTYEHLNTFLHDPAGTVPGTKMTFAGLKNDSERANVIAYLRTLAADPVPLPEPEAAAPAEGEGTEGEAAAEGAAAEESTASAEEMAPAEEEAPAAAEEAPAEDAMAPADGEAAPEEAAPEEPSDAMQAPEETAPADEQQGGMEPSADQETAAADQDAMEPAAEEPAAEQETAMAEQDTMEPAAEEPAAMADQETEEPAAEQETAMAEQDTMEPAAEEPAAMADQGTEEPAAEQETAMATAEEEATAMPAGDVEKGKNFARRCLACHTFEEGGANKVGPHLFGVFERPIASVSDYAYSDAMVEFSEGGSKHWDAEMLDAYLADPRGVVKGAKMIFPGVKSDADRANLIAYLASLQ
jgi:cytochrome c2